jgi:hypothetical protein
VRNAAVLADHECLRDPIHSPINGDAPADVCTPARIRIAKAIKPPRRVLLPVLVVEPVDRNVTRRTRTRTR